MLTALNIDNLRDNRSVIKRFLSALRGDTMRVTIRQAGDIKLKCIEYTQRRKTVNLNRIDKEVGVQRNHLLCNKETVLDSEQGYKRFENSEFKHRLCTNVAVGLLCSLKELDVKVGLLDTNAVHTNLVRYLLKYIDNFTVVTQSVDEYMQVSDILLEETGVPIRLSKSADTLSNCDLIIAPEHMNFDIELKSNALVLTDKAPKKEVTNTVIYEYNVSLPNCLSTLCPQWLDSTYFASALYTVEKVYRLGALLPEFCVGNTGVHTISSLKKLLVNICDKT